MRLKLKNYKTFTAFDLQFGGETFVLLRLATLGTLSSAAPWWCAVPLP